MEAQLDEIIMLLETCVGWLHVISYATIFTAAGGLFVVGMYAARNKQFWG